MSNENIELVCEECGDDEYLENVNGKIICMSCSCAENDSHIPDDIQICRAFHGNIDKCCGKCF